MVNQELWCGQKTHGALACKEVNLPEIKNLDAVPDEFTDDPQFITKMKTKYLGAFAGSERIYVNIDYVKPGAMSVKYHSHSLQEEFFLILAGSGSVRIQGEILPVNQGDFFAKPAGKGIAHQFINDGNEVLEILDCGVSDKNDIIEYPDQDILFVKNQSAVFKRGSAIKGWSTDPNT